MGVTLSDEQYGTVAETFEQTMRRQVEEMPAWRFVCERDWISGPHRYAVGFLWDRNFKAEPGDFIYQRRALITIKFHIGIDWRVSRPNAQVNEMER